MKTKTFEGTDQQFLNLLQAVSKYDTDRMPQQIAESTTEVTTDLKYLNQRSESYKKSYKKTLINSRYSKEYNNVFIHTEEIHEPKSSLNYSNSLLLSIDEAEALKNHLTDLLTEIKKL